MRIRTLAACFAAAAICMPAATRAQPTPVPASALVPRSPRTTPLSLWTPSTGRSLLSANVDGAVLRGYAYRGSDPGMKLTVLFFNGSGAPLNGAGFPTALAELGPDVDAYDYRGFGWSTGSADIMAIRQDALKLFDKTASEVGGPSHVVVLGYSFGTPVAAYVASERPVRGLVLISSLATIKEQLTMIFTTYSGMTPQEAEALPYSDDAQTAYDVKKMVAESTAPLLVIHGDADRNVPISEGREVFRVAAGRPKRFVTLPGVNHNAPGQPDSLAAIKTFLNGLRR